MKLEINTIYNEDCLITMSKMPDKYVDLTLTDPPYGIGLKYDSYDDTEESWYSLMEKVIPEMIRVSKMVIFPCCKIARLDWFYKNFPPDWLICWYKGSTGHRSYIGFNDWEPHVVYGKRVSKLCMHDYFHTVSSPTKGTFNHPCPKPTEWADWLITRVAMKDKILIYDPFAGSGTVPLVAKQLGHSYIGSEISDKYCDIANDRLKTARMSFV